MKNTALRNTLAGLVLVLGAGCRGGSDNDGGEGEGPPGADEGDSDGDGADGDDADDGNDDGPSPTEICAELSFDNIVDEAACPDIQGLGIEPVAADEIEICRRGYIDLLGRSPTGSDYERDCKWGTAEEFIDDFLARPEYVRLSQRMWADVFHMTSGITHYQYLADLDARAGDLHSGIITLDQFAQVAATHPGFLGRWDGLDLVSFSFKAFLGRDANPAEREELEPLWHMWEERAVADPMQSGAMNVVLNTLRCTAPNEADCNSTLWGDQTVIVPPPMPGDTNPDGPNVIDQSMLTDAQWDLLRTPGKLITEQAAFYEAYVDRALTRYLGYDVGTPLPLVRQALVDLMIEEGGNVLAIDREILTSGLYMSSNLYDEKEKQNPNKFDPPYWHGPVKQMDAETWLASAQTLIGATVGSCDHRYPVVQSGGQGLHPHSYPTTDGTTPDYAFRDDAQLLGGCPDHVDAFRETRSGLIAALTQATLTETMCDQANEESLIYPLQFIEDGNDKTVEALSTAANQIYSAALIRAIPDDAAEALDAGVEGCRDVALDCEPVEFARQACRLVLKSADFLFY